MKLAFVDVRYKKRVVLPQDFLDMLPARSSSSSTSSSTTSTPTSRRRSRRGARGAHGAPKHAWHEGQILGCSVEEWMEGQDAFVYVGDGLFHPKAVLFANTQPMFIHDPKTGKSRTLTRRTSRRSRARARARSRTFYSSQHVGMLLTTKYGQARIEQALKLREKFPRQDVPLPARGRDRFPQASRLPVHPVLRQHRVPAHHGRQREGASADGEYF